MKAIDELIDKYKGFQLSFSIGSVAYNNFGHIWMDLETLKEQLSTNVKTDNSKVNENLLEEIESYKNTLLEIYRILPRKDCNNRVWNLISKEDF